MKSNFEEKKEAQLEAYQRLAEKNEKLSDSAYETAREIGSFIPMGQPILVGHHSEKRHRRDLEKIDNNMRKSVEATDKAAYYKNRADNLLNGTAISSDNPDAVELLREKLEGLMATQELYKGINKIVKSNKWSSAEKITLLMDLGLNNENAVKMLTPGNFGGMGVPSYRLTNNNGVINNTRKRIEHLEKINAMDTTEEIINGVRLVVSVEDNRVQIFFDGKPSEDIRKQCKAAGFHWAPSVGAWMRQISNYAIHQAKEILNNLKP